MAHQGMRGAVCALALLMPTLVQAQETQVAQAGDVLDEIIVTATKAGETTMQRTPLAISAFSADKLDSSLVLNVKDLVAVTPNLSVAQVTASAVIYMRGIGSSNVFGGSDPSVTTQIDGVYIARAFGQFQDFVDIQRVEVLRGPQGTLYGRNAVGGTINIISKKPSDKATGKLQLTVGDYERRQAQFYVSGPLVEEKLQASLSGTYIRHDDYIDNIVATGQPGTNNANRGGLRGQVRFLPADNVEMITRFDYSRSDERFDSYSHLLVPFRPGGANPTPLASGIVGDYSKVALDSPQTNDTKLWGVAQEVNIDLTDALAVKSLTAFRKSRYNLFVDSDGTELLAQTSNQNEWSRQFSQELNLTGNFDRFNGVLGLFYFHDKTSTLLQSTNYASPVLPPANAFYIRTEPDSFTTSFAAFAQGTYKLTDDLGFTAGLRFTQDTKRIEQNFDRVSLATGSSTPGFPFVYELKRKFDAVTPKFGLDYQVTSDIMLYASATRGFKSGGTSIFANNATDLSFAPETIWAYEGGIKSDLLDRRLRFNTSLFHYDYKDLQVQSLIAPGVVAIRNAANARVRGVEFELTARPVSGLELGGNLSFLDTKYRAFPTSSVPNQLVNFVATDPRFNAASRTFDATGNRLNAAPKSSLSTYGQYNFDVGPGTAFIRGEYFRQSKVYYDASNADIFSQKAYDLINASVGWNSDEGGWGVQVVGKNLADEQYLITVAANGLVPAGLAGAPRTFVLQVSKSW
ncbi:TonB-dependent receptor [Niveispirillum fermenti]|uniref:TonB-dependent receptor n=1 Tax=Niveispirillum fermenti TaxID=1233113 RepID=UPI003A86E191